MPAIVAPVPSTHPTGYSAAQIVLHWVIAAMVVFQLVMGEEIAETYRVYRQGRAADADELFQADIHVYIGLAVLVLAVARLVLRVTHGAPPLPAGQPKIQTAIAHLAHAVLYVAIFAMPISGAVAWYLDVPLAGEVHELAKPVIIVTVLVHAVGALLQHFVKRTDVLTRMLRPERRTA
ncbi:cytochrome b [Aquibium microcysteis]|uniref:cytochrome b n=1 Tax=Aquibium microcysteis TaxID=675281 RepID=UPI00165D1E24|nr:cytochrome b/b6 domain-containing protein [Aquibium microcysteis]